MYSTSLLFHLQVEHPSPQVTHIIYILHMSWLLHLYSQCEVPSCHKGMLSVIANSYYTSKGKEYNKQHMANIPVKKIERYVQN